ncbi:MAG: carboxypeptidase regulatory-like domain-containing protein [Desulfobacter sp.]|nr:carboxypeptidase regulatory-like domain-containing protein [Desulfobacter sp.]
MKKAYTLYFTAASSNMLQRKVKPTFEAAWQAYPSLKPEYTMGATHKGGKARPVSSNAKTRMILTLEIYGFSGNLAQSATQKPNFQYNVFFSRGQRVETLLGNSIQLVNDRGGKNAWMTEGCWAVSLRPQRVGDDIPVDVFRLAADGLFKAMGSGGKMVEKTGQDPYIVDISCQATGYKTQVRSVGSKTEPQTIRVSGVVKNETGDAVEGALIRIDEYDETAKTDEDGKYSLKLAFVDGKGSLNHTQDFVLQTTPNALGVSIDFNTDQMPRADGRSLEAQILVTNQGQPWANKKMMFNPPSRFMVKGIPVWYIERPFPAGLSTAFTTDEQGRAKILFPVPRVKKYLLKQTPKENPADLLFPISGEVTFVDGMTEKSVTASVNYGNPYPRVLKLVLPGLWNGKWPSARGQLILSENQCQVELKAYGRFRVKGYEADKTVKVWTDNDPSLFFGYMPRVEGADDFNDIPDYGMAMGKAMSDSVVELAVGELGGNLMNQYGTTRVGSTDAVDRMKKTAQNKMDWAQGFQQAAAKAKFDADHAAMVMTSAKEMQSKAGRYITAGVTGDEILAVSGAILENAKAGLSLRAMAQGGRPFSGQLSAQKNAIELGSTAYGLFDAGAGVTKWGSKAIDQAGKRLIALKLIYTAAKTTHDCYIEYQRTALGWDAAVLMPFVATITNEQGYAVRTIRYAPCKI